MTKGPKAWVGPGQHHANSATLVPEIRKLNASFLKLARKLLANGQSDALSSLGISQAMADILVAMPEAEIAKLANTNLVLCRFYFGSHVLAELITKPHLEEWDVHESALPMDEVSTVDRH